MALFELSETLILLDAQQRTLAALDASYVQSDLIDWKIAHIILRIAHRRHKAGQALDAGEIAFEARHTFVALAVDESVLEQPLTA